MEKKILFFSNYVHPNVREEPTTSSKLARGIGKKPGCNSKTLAKKR